jgi:hypothetical protein
VPRFIRSLRRGTFGATLAVATLGCRGDREPSRAAQQGPAPPAQRLSSVEGAAQVVLAPPPERGAALEQATLVCRALQGTAAERRSACCGQPIPSALERDCVRALGEAIAAGRIAVEADRLASCREASERAFAGCDWVTPGQPIPPAACGELTRGLGSRGDVCRSSLECASPLHCAGNTPTQPGRCAEPLPVGAACSTPVDVLAGYLFARALEKTHPWCSGVCSALSHRCEATPRAECGADADCAGGGPCRAKRCVAAGSRGERRAGEACQTDFDCGIGGCSGTPGTCGMKCAISFADRARSAERAPMALPRRSAKSGPAGR